MNNSSSCFVAHQFQTFDDFFACYKIFFSNNTALAIVEIILLVSIVLINATVIVKIGIKKRQPNAAIYDTILFWLSSYYLLTALVDIPFFLLEQEIGYWGFGETSSIIWAIYDNNMNTFVSLLELYMTYSRYRSVHAPFSYLNERLLRYPNLLISSMWLFGCPIWFLTVFFSHTFPYSTHVDYTPNILQFVINAIMWFSPLFSVYVIGGLIVHKLKKIQKMKKSMSTQTHATKTRTLYRAIFDPKARFSIIIVAFLVQWTVPCLFMLVETFLPMRIESLILAFKWSTYTVILTDPILILTFC